MGGIGDLCTNPCKCGGGGGGGVLGTSLEVRWGVLGTSVPIPGSVVGVLGTSVPIPGSVVGGIGPFPKGNTESRKLLLKHVHMCLLGGQCMCGSHQVSRGGI